MTLPEFLSPLTSPTAAVVGCLFLSLCSCHWELFSSYWGFSFQILFARGTSSVWILEFDGATRLRNRRRSRMTPGTGHDPPIIICVTASLLRQMQNQNQFIPVSPWRCKHVWGHGINKNLVPPTWWLYLGAATSRRADRSYYARRLGHRLGSLIIITTTWIGGCPPLVTRWKLSAQFSLLHKPESDDYSRPGLNSTIPIWRKREMHLLLHFDRNQEYSAQVLFLRSVVTRFVRNFWKWTFFRWGDAFWSWVRGRKFWPWVVKNQFWVEDWMGRVTSAGYWGG